MRAQESQAGPGVWGGYVEGAGEPASRLSVYLFVHLSQLFSFFSLLFSPSCNLFYLLLLILLPPLPFFPSLLLWGPQREHHVGMAMPSTYAVSRHGSSPSTG